MGATNGISVDGGANEGLVAPSITSVTSSQMIGTSSPNGTVDIIMDGAFLAEVTADGLGDFEYNGSISGSTVYTTLTNANNSTSPASFPSGIVPDLTAPTVPVITSSAATTNNANYTLTGTKEGHSSIETTLVELVAIDQTTSFSTVVVLTEGENTISIRSADYSGNRSDLTSIEVTLDTTAPNAPGFQSYNNVTTSSSVELRGQSGEVGASIYINGNDTGKDVDQWENSNTPLVLALEEIVMTSPTLMMLEM